MAVPTIDSISPVEGLAEGRALVEIAGTGFALPPPPPPEGMYHSRREETYFDVGYEQGLAAGWAEALWARRAPCIETSHADETRALAHRIRDIAFQADLAPPLTLSAILEAARAIALDLDDSRSA